MTLERPGLFNWLKNAVCAVYHHLWGHLLQRREPFTPQLCRMEEAWSWGFWFLLDAAVVALWELLKRGGLWQSALIIGVYLFTLWLKDHLIDYIQAHPDNRPH